MDLLEVVHYLDDHYSDLAEAGDLSDEYLSGFGHARYEVRQLQLMEDADCCRDTFPVQLKNNDWQCEECDTIVLEDDPEGRPHKPEGIEPYRVTIEDPDETPD